MSDDLKVIEGALEAAKWAIGSQIVIRGYGDEIYSKILLGLSALDRLRQPKDLSRTELSSSAIASRKPFHYAQIADQDPVAIGENLGYLMDHFETIRAALLGEGVIEAIRDGKMVVVPVDCTDEIAEAIANLAHCCGGIAESIWRASIKAAQE